MTAEGQVFGLAQKSSGKDTATICYAVGADYAMAQKISPLSFNDHTLLSIGIKKALPETEEQALVYLYMASSQLAPEKYTELLNEFISQYPNSADGYLRRANNQIFQSKEASSMDKVAADMDKALEVAQKKDDAYFNRAKLIYGYQLDKPEKPIKIGHMTGLWMRFVKRLQSKLFRFIFSWKVISSLPRRTMRLLLPVMRR